MTDSIFSSTRTITSSTVLQKTGKRRKQSNTSDITNKAFSFRQPDAGFQDLFGEVREDIIGQMSEGFSGTPYDGEMPKRPNRNSVFDNGIDDQRQSNEMVEYKIVKGDTLWGISRQRLIDKGISEPTDFQISKITQGLMRLNPDLEPRRLQEGQTINLFGPMTGIEFSPGKSVQNAAINTKSQQNVGDKNEREMDMLIDSIPDELITVHSPGNPTKMVPGEFDPKNCHPPAKETEPFDVLTVLDPISDYSNPITKGLQGGYEVSKAIKDMKAGWHYEAVVDADGKPKLGARKVQKVKVFGPENVSESRGLSGKTRYVDIDNPKIRDAKLPGKMLGNTLTAVGAAMEIAPDVVRWKKGDMTGVELTGRSTENMIEAVTVSGATTAVIAGTTSLAGAVFGTAAVATAPVWLTVGAAVGIGYGVAKLYDSFLEKNITNLSVDLWKSVLEK